MPDLEALRQPIIVDVIARAEPVKELTNEVRKTNSEFEALSRSTQESINKQLDNVRITRQNILSTLSNIRETISNIEKANIDLASEQNTLQLNQSRRLSTETLRNRERFETAADIGIIAGSRGRSSISGEQVIDILLTIDPSDEIKSFRERVKLRNNNIEQIEIGRDLELGLEAAPGAFMGIGKIPLTDERREELQQQLVELDNEAARIEKRIAEIQRNDLLKEDPLQFEIDDLDASIAKTLGTIDDLEEFKVGQRVELKELKSQLEVFLQDYAGFFENLRQLGLTDQDIENLGLNLGDDIIQQIEDLGIEIPGLKFEIDGIEGVEQGLNNIPEQLENIDKTATASAMSLDTMSDASIGFIGNVIKLNDEGLQPLNTNLDETTDQFEQARTSVGNLNPSLVNLATVNQNVANTQGQVAEGVEATGEAFDNGAEGAMQFAQETENASATLDALGVFAADVAANINDAFSDLIFNAIKGNFDSLGDLWENTLDSMLQALSQFASTVISNPIRVVLEGALSGNFGGGGGGGGGIGSLLGGIGGGLGNQQNVIFLEDYKGNREELRLAA